MRCRETGSYIILHQGQVDSESWAMLYLECDVREQTRSQTFCTLVDGDRSQAGLGEQLSRNGAAGVGCCTLL